VDVIAKPSRVNDVPPNFSRLSTGQKPVAVFLNDFFSGAVPANLERIAPTRCTIDATLDQAGQTYHVKSEQPGMGVFYKDGNGDVIHTYFCYARGLDILIGVQLPRPHAQRSQRAGLDGKLIYWVRHYDRYDDGAATSPDGRRYPYHFRLLRTPGTSIGIA
jgi:uncharacterized protein DUF899